MDTLDPTDSKGSMQCKVVVRGLVWCDIMLNRMGGRCNPTSTDDHLRIKSNAFTRDHQPKPLLQVEQRNSLTDNELAPST
jgi:hypothetical protein